MMKKTARILLVEDDPMMNLLISTTLAQGGYKAMCVFNGEDAVKKVKQNKFDIIITDLLMPGKEGMEVIQEAKEHDPTIKIIAISGGGRVGHTSFLELARAHGADVGIDKPCSPADILMTVEEMTRQ
jgi:DNA-binding response OmpR family regulator